MHYLKHGLGKRLKVQPHTEVWKEASFLCSQCHFPMGLPVSTYLGYKILQPENDISSGKDTSVLFFFLSSFTYYFSISGYSQLKVEQQI